MKNYRLAPVLRGATWGLGSASFAWLIFGDHLYGIGLALLAHLCWRMSDYYWKITPVKTFGEEGER